MISRRIFVGLSIPFVLASCTTAKDYSKFPAGTSKPYASIRHVSYSSPAAVQVQNDRIQAQDLLNISVYKVPELSQSMRVDGAGIISFPLVGDINTKGLTARALERKIEQGLAGRFMKNPQVTVVIKEAVKRRVTIEGDAVRPGVYPVVGGGTILQAIASAGGLNEFGDINKIFLFRTSPSGEVKRYHVNLVAIRDGAAQDPVLHNDDRLVIHRNNGYYNTKKGVELLGGIISPLTVGANN